MVISFRLERLSLLERSSSRRRRANSNSPVILALHLWAEYQDISLHSLHSLLTSHCMTYQIFMYIIFACIYIYTSIIYHISASLRIPINPYLWAGGKGLHANSGLGRSLQYKDHLEIVFHNTAKPVKTKAITIVLYTCICMCIHIE